MKYHKLVENAEKPKGFWGKLMIRSMNKGHSNLTDWALKQFVVESGDIVLDVGCGGGKTVDKLCAMVGSGKVYGIDYSELCVKSSKKLNHKNILCHKAVISQASVSSLPFEDNTFNKITAVETYYFWPDKPDALREICRVLKPGGKLLLVFEMVEDPFNPGKWSAVEQKLNIKAVSEDGIAKALAEAGYINISTYTEESAGWLCAVAQKEII